MLAVKTEFAIAAADDLVDGMPAVARELELHPVAIGFHAFQDILEVVGGQGFECAVPAFSAGSAQDGLSNVTLRRGHKLYAHQSFRSKKNFWGASMHSMFCPVGALLDQQIGEPFGLIMAQALLPNREPREFMTGFIRHAPLLTFAREFDATAMHDISVRKP